MEQDHGKTAPSTVDKLHTVTPLLRSFQLEDIATVPVYLKCDNCQPSGSFKIRGIGHFMQKCHDDGIRRVVIASGGNAGLAVAYSANVLGMDATVVCPVITATEVSDAIQRLGSTVLRHGHICDVANKEALRISVDEDRVYVHPFDHPTIWEGHATVIDEIKDQLGDVKPRCVVVSVGGGGYLAGVLEGLKRNNWSDVPVVALETIGTACFNESIRSGKLVAKENIQGIAHTLKAKRVARRVFEAAINKEHPIISVTVSDEQALDACFKFLDHHRFLVEPSCGAVLAAIYSGIIKDLVTNGQISKLGPVVALVCGGRGVTLKHLKDWKKELRNSTL